MVNGQYCYFSGEHEKRRQDRLACAGISAELKAVLDRLHTPMRNKFSIKKTALFLVGAAELPELFDAIKLQYQLVLNFFHLKDLSMAPVREVKDKDDIKGNVALKEAYDLGLSIK